MTARLIRSSSSVSQDGVLLRRLDNNSNENNCIARILRSKTKEVDKFAASIRACAKQMEQLERHVALVQLRHRDELRQGRQLTKKVGSDKKTNRSCSDVTTDDNEPCPFAVHFGLSQSLCCSVSTELRKSKKKNGEAEGHVIPELSDNEMMFLAQMEDLCCDRSSCSSSSSSRITSRRMKRKNKAKRGTSSIFSSKLLTSSLFSRRSISSCSGNSAHPSSCGSSAHPSSSRNSALPSSSGSSAHPSTPVSSRCSGSFTIRTSAGSIGGKARTSCGKP